MPNIKKGDITGVILNRIYLTLFPKNKAEITIESLIKSVFVFKNKYKEDDIDFITSTINFDNLIEKNNFMNSYTAFEKKQTKSSRENLIKTFETNFDDFYKSTSKSKICEERLPAFKVKAEGFMPISTAYED